MMPEMDGFELIRQIRSDPAIETVPFIMLSARAGDASAVEGLTRGADDYLVKPFSSEELLARVYAQLNAAAIRARATQELRANEERFRTLAASMPHIVLEGDPRNGVTFLSEAFSAYTGLPDESGYGLGWLGAVHADDVAEARRRWDAALRSGGEFVASSDSGARDGAYRWHLARALVRDERGTEYRSVGQERSPTSTTCGDPPRSERFSQRPAAFLGNRSTSKRRSKAWRRITVPLFADWCQIDLATAEGGIRTVAVAHRDPVKHALAQRFVGQVHLNPNADRAVPYTMRTGRTDLIEDVAAIAPQAVDDDSDLDVYNRLGLRSAVCVPMVAEGRTLGVVALNYGESERHYTADDVPVLEELGRRAGVAVSARERVRARASGGAVVPGGVTPAPVADAPRRGVRCGVRAGRQRGAGRAATGTTPCGSPTAASSCRSATSPDTASRPP